MKRVSGRRRRVLRAQVPRRLSNIGDSKRGVQHGEAVEADDGLGGDPSAKRKEDEIRPVSRGKEKEARILYYLMYKER